MVDITSECKLALEHALRLIWGPNATGDCVLNKEVKHKQNWSWSLLVEREDGVDYFAHRRDNLPRKLAVAHRRRE